MVVEGSGERLSPASSCPIRVQLARDLGILLASTVVHHEEYVESHQPYVDVRCPAKKSTSPSCRRNGSSIGWCASKSEVIGAPIKLLLMIMVANDIRGWMRLKFSRHLFYS